MLRLENISKSFPQRGIVLDNLSLTVLEGDMVAVTGPSGSGKSTLLNIIGKLEEPDTGTVWFREKPLKGFTPDDSALFRNREIGFVFQEHLLLPHLKVIENILLPVAASNPSDEIFEEKREYASYLMKRTGIEQLGEKYPFNISGGEAQRANLVRALINRPSMLLADEPTGSLDTRNADLMGDLLKELNNELGITLLIVTHSQSMASKMKSHYNLEGGRLIG